MTIWWQFKLLFHVFFFSPLFKRFFMVVGPTRIEVKARRWRLLEDGELVGYGVADSHQAAVHAARDAFRDLVQELEGGAHGR